YRTRIASSSSFLRRASLDLLAASLFFRRFTQYSSLFPSLPVSFASEEEFSATGGSGLKELLPPFSDLSSCALETAAASAGFKESTNSLILSKFSHNTAAHSIHDPQRITHTNSKFVLLPSMGISGSLSSFVVLPSLHPVFLAITIFTCFLCFGRRIFCYW
ncbi:hypothetical protein C0J52_27199, partial [Blattella germanica]